MSLSLGVWINEVARITSEESVNLNMEALTNMQSFINDTALIEQDILHASDSTTSSYTTDVSGEVISVDPPVKRLRSSSKRFKHYYPHKMPRAKRPRKSCSRAEDSPRTITYSNKLTSTDEPLVVTPEIDIVQDVSEECQKFTEFGNLLSKDPFACSIYITSYDGRKVNMQITPEPLVDILYKIVSGKVKVEKTLCGIMVAFTKESDAERVMDLPLQDIFKGAIQVAQFPTGESNFHKSVTIKDVPWCISNVEIFQALKQQGINAGKVTRTRTYVKIEVMSSLDVYRLIEEGLNFFNYTTFPAVIDNTVINQGEIDIIQCYKCQGFWHTSTHCRQMPRCVRCGENHEVEYCPRLRNDPVCCHCGGPHHAAFKMCPVRLQHINSTYIGFQLTKSKPLRTFAHNIF